MSKRGCFLGVFQEKVRARRQKYSTRDATSSKFFTKRRLFLSVKKRKWLKTLDSTFASHENEFREREKYQNDTMRYVNYYG